MFAEWWDHPTQLLSEQVEAMFYGVIWTLGIYLSLAKEVGSPKGQRDALNPLLDTPRGK